MRSKPAAARASAGSESIPESNEGANPTGDVASDAARAPGETGVGVIPRPERSSPAREPASVQANRTVLALHLVVAPFVVLREYTITQDGPSHLYGAHVLWSLRHDPSSPYVRFFASNLRPIGNSLFSYLAVALEGVLSSAQISGLALVAALWALPLSALAFDAALRSAAPTGSSTALPAVAATSLACPLAYNYFLYRGFFNYTLGVPLAMLCLSAVIASGARRNPLEQASCAGVAFASAVLASLAHPAATVFLLAAIPLACFRGARIRKVLGASVVGVLVAFSLASRIAGNRIEPVRFSSPLSAAWMFVRAVGVTHSVAEVSFAVPLLVLAGWGAFRVARSLRRDPRAWGEHWPGLLAIALAGAYFFVPFEFGGVAGLNERIPLFVVLLLLPYVPLTISWNRSLVVGFVAFCAYTAVESIPRNQLARRVREARAVELIPRGSLVYPVALQNKLASLSADLGLHLLADIARQRDLIMPEVFCSHPAHVLRCIGAMPGGFNPSAIQKFEHLSDSERRRALDDPSSAVRTAFDRIVESVGHAEYLLVLRAAPLDAAFDEHVVKRLRTTRLGPSDEPVGVYRLNGDGTPAEENAGLPLPLRH